MSGVEINCLLTAIVEMSICCLMKKRLPNYHQLKMLRPGLSACLAHPKERRCSQMQVRLMMSALRQVLALMESGCSELKYSLSNQKNCCRKMNSMIFITKQPMLLTGKSLHSGCLTLEEINRYR